MCEIRQRDKIITDSKYYSVHADTTCTRMIPCVQPFGLEAVNEGLRTTNSRYYSNAPEIPETAVADAMAREAKYEDPAESLLNEEGTLTMQRLELDTGVESILESDFSNFEGDVVC